MLLVMHAILLSNTLQAGSVVLSVGRRHKGINHNTLAHVHEDIRCYIELCWLAPQQSVESWLTREKAFPKLYEAHSQDISLEHPP